MNIGLIEFARTKGARDKKKRKRRRDTILAGTSLGAVTLGGSYYGTNKALVGRDAELHKLRAELRPLQSKSKIAKLDLEREVAALSDIKDRAKDFNRLFPGRERLALRKDLAQELPGRVKYHGKNIKELSSSVKKLANEVQPLEKQLSRKTFTYNTLKRINKVSKIGAVTLAGATGLQLLGRLGKGINRAAKAERDYLNRKLG